MTKKRILIVDDQGELRKLVRMTLEFEDYELHEAEDGERALGLVKAIKPDLVILDVMMPGDCNGYDVCQQIKDNPEFSDIYIVLLTARGQKEDLERGSEVGADTYLVKPFSPIELIGVVKEGLA